MAEEFKLAHKELSSTVKDLYSFNELQGFLLKALRNVNVRLINSGSDTRPGDIHWPQNYSWILVGGKALDRGFTLEGLTVSYIPRRAGAGMADVIQQRGRFFGYKKSYMGYCRVFLLSDSRNAFTEYVEHEESLREEIQEAIDKGQKAKDWRRAFLLSPRLIPCRRNVIEKQYTRGKFSAQWVHPNRNPANDQFRDHNNKLIESFISGKKIIPHLRISESDSKLEIRKVASPPTLKEVLEQLLLGYRYLHRLDTERILGAIFQLNVYISRCNGASEEKCDVFLMNQEKNRERTIDSQGKIKALFQGRSPGKDIYYDGDSEVIEDRNNVAVQVHNLALKQDNKIISKDLPILAIWIPEKLAKTTQAWLIQAPSEK